MKAVMKDSELLYKTNNSVQRRDASETLQEYNERIKWKAECRVLDIGCGDGGVTVDVLRPCLPQNFELLLGCDLNKTMVEHANKHHRDNKTEFSVLDIQGAVPDEMLGKFDYVFSSYTLHWIQQQEKAFKNIYKVLDKGGECLLLFLGRHPIFDMFRNASNDSKWRAYMEDIKNFVSPYHDFPERGAMVRNIMKNVGFHDIDVQCKEKVFVYEPLESFKNTLTVINPFDIPSELHEEFLEESVSKLDTIKDIKLITRNKEIDGQVDVQVGYTLIVAYGKKI